MTSNNSFDNIFGDYLFNINTKDCEYKLNYLYYHDSRECLMLLDKVKKARYKVLRNAAGKHKVQISL